MGLKSHQLLLQDLCPNTCSPSGKVSPSCSAEALLSLALLQNRFLLVRGSEDNLSIRAAPGLSSSSFVCLGFLFLASVCVGFYRDLCSHVYNGSQTPSSLTGGNG